MLGGRGPRTQPGRGWEYGTLDCYASREKDEGGQKFGRLLNNKYDFNRKDTWHFFGCMSTIRFLLMQVLSCFQHACVLPSNSCNYTICLHQIVL